MNLVVGHHEGDDAETPEYAKKLMKMEITMLKVMECRGFRASLPARWVEVLGQENTLE